MRYTMHDRKALRQAPICIAHPLYPRSRQVGALGDAPPLELEPVDLVVDAGVRGAPIANADRQHAQCAVLLRFFVRLFAFAAMSFLPLQPLAQSPEKNRSYTRETPLPTARAYGRPARPTTMRETRRVT